MNSQDERRFFEFIMQMGGEFLFMKNLQIFNTKEPSKLKNTKIYIYSKEFGELKIYNESRINNDNVGYFSEIDSPVIVYTPTKFVLEYKEVKAGRIYLKMSFTDGQNIIKKSKTLEKFYNILNLWIDGNIPKNTINMGFYDINLNISPSIFAMFKSGMLQNFK